MEEQARKRLSELRARLSELAGLNARLQQENQRAANEYLKVQGGIEELEALLAQERKENSR